MARFESLQRIALVSVVFGCLVLPSIVAAGPTVPHKESCNGTATFPTPTSLAFTGKGTATHLGVYKITGSNQLTADGKVINGTFSSIASDSSTISGTYAGTYTVFLDKNGVPAKVRFDVKVSYNQGAKRLAGVTGQANTTALLDLATMTFHYDTLGALTKP